MAVFHHQTGEGKRLGSDHDPEVCPEALQARQTVVAMFGWKSLVTSLARVPGYIWLGDPLGLLMSARTANEDLSRLQEW